MRYLFGLICLSVGLHPQIGWSTPYEVSENLNEQIEIMLPLLKQFNAKGLSASFHTTAFSRYNAYKALNTAQRRKESTFVRAHSLYYIGKTFIHGARTLTIHQKLVAFSGIDIERGQSQDALTNDIIQLGTIGLEVLQNARKLATLSISKAREESNSITPRARRALISEIDLLNGVFEVEQQYYIKTQQSFFK